jgi:hypothetical protein
VSKNGLALMRLGAVERKSRRQWTAQPAEALQGLFSTAIAAHFELARARNADFDVVASFRSNASTTVAGSRIAKLFPLRHLHNVPSRGKDIHGHCMVSTGEVRSVTRHRRGCLDIVSAILELLLGSTVRGTSVPLTRGTSEESHAAVLSNVRFILMIGTTIPTSP